MPPKLPRIFELRGGGERRRGRTLRPTQSFAGPVERRDADDRVLGAEHDALDRVGATDHRLRARLRGSEVAGLTQPVCTTGSNAAGSERRALAAALRCDVVSSMRSSSNSIALDLTGGRLERMQREPELPPHRRISTPTHCTPHGYPLPVEDHLRRRTFGMRLKRSARHSEQRQQTTYLRQTSVSVFLIRALVTILLMMIVALFGEKFFRVCR